MARPARLSGRFWLFLAEFCRSCLLSLNAGAFLAAKYLSDGLSGRPLIKEATPPLAKGGNIAETVEFRGCNAHSKSARASQSICQWEITATTSPARRIITCGDSCGTHVRSAT